MSWYKRLENKWKKATKRQQLWTYIGAYTVSFIVVFLITWSPFLQGKKSFVWQSDGRLQHYPYLVYVGRYLRRILISAAKGKFEVPLFDLSIGAGDDVLGFLNSQGATDPLLLVSAFVPMIYSEYLYAFLAIFRVFLSGLSFSFLCTYYNKQRSCSLIGSIVYSFSGYAILVSMRHPYFVNPMIILPLLIVGIDKVLKKKRLYVLTCSVLYAALCGYYHLYMMTIMISIYFLVRFFDLYKTDRIKNFVLLSAKALFGYCMGIGLSAIIFFPGIAEFLNAGRNGFINNKDFYTWSYIRTRLLRLIAPPGNEIDLAFAAIVLLALILLFFQRDKFSLKILTISAFAVYLTSIGGLIMNGFQYPSQRWTFGFVLIVSYVVVEMFPKLLNLSREQQWICLITVCAYIFAIFLTSKTRKLTYVFVGSTFLALTALVLMMQIFEIGPQKTYDRYEFIRKIRTLMCLILVLINVGINGFYRFAADQANYSSEFARFGYEVDYLENAIDREAEKYLLNNLIGRVDSSSFISNTAMVWKIPEMLYYSSIENGSVSEFWNEVENSRNQMLFNMQSSDQRTIINTLLSTGYHIESENNQIYVPYGYNAIEKLENGTIIYENNFALPWGYTYDATISYNTLNKMNGLQKQESMLQAIALEDIKSKTLVETVQFDEYALPYEIKYENCKWEDDELVVSNENAKIKLNFSLPAGVEGYVRLVGLNINESGQTGFWFNVNCDNVSKSSYASSYHFNWYWGRENYLFNLGYSEDKRTSLTITFPSEGTFKLNNIELFALPMDNYPAHVEALRAEPLENIEWSTNRLTGTIDLSKDKVLCISIPYSKGWSAKVDGKKIEILRGNYMFMAIPLTAGHHNIEFNYFSPGLKLGIAITVISLGIFIGMFLYDKRKR